MAAHARGFHQGEIRFQIEVLRSFRSSFDRQIGETIMTKQYQQKGYLILNSKTEYNRCYMPELQIEPGKNKVPEVEISTDCEETVLQRGRELETDNETEFSTQLKSKRRKRLEIGIQSKRESDDTKSEEEETILISKQDQEIKRIRREEDQNPTPAPEVVKAEYVPMGNLLSDMPIEVESP